jgi:RNA polymerase sigma-70 factor (ECF subfamily)
LVKERERAQLLWDALRKIDEKFRTPLVLAEVEGLSYDDIATIEGVPIGTVRSRIARAKDRLRELLTATSPGDFASDSGTVGVPTSSQPVTEESR